MTAELTTAKEQLAQQVSEHQQTVNQFTQQLGDKKTELSEANESLQQRIDELTSINEQLEKQAAEYGDLEEIIGESTKDASKSILPTQILDEGELQSLAEMAKRLS